MKRRQRWHDEKMPCKRLKTCVLTCLLVAIALAVFAPCSTAFADSGMWTPDGVYRYTLREDEHGDQIATIVE